MASERRVTMIDLWTSLWNETWNSLPQTIRPYVVLCNIDNLCSGCHWSSATLTQGSDKVFDCVAVWWKLIALITLCFLVSDDWLEPVEEPAFLHSLLDELVWCSWFVHSVRVHRQASDRPRCAEAKCSILVVCDRQVKFVCVIHSYVRAKWPCIPGQQTTPWTGFSEPFQVYSSTNRVLSLHLGFVLWQVLQIL